MTTESSNDGGNDGGNESSNALMPQEQVARLGCWRGDVDPVPVAGGISNLNFQVEDQGEKFFVRLGEDIPVHGVLRWHELATSRAAHAAGVSPEVVHYETGVLVLRWVEGQTLEQADVRDEKRLRRIVDTVRTLHERAPMHFRGPVLTFWAFHVLHGYAARLREDSSRHISKISRLLEIARQLERDVGAIQLRFGHNDLLPANLIDDGERIWVIDFEYAGYNSPLFDLGGLASNSEMEPEQERRMLQLYSGNAPDTGLQRSYSAMKCASLLREAVWSMVSEIHSHLQFDYSAYTAVNLDRFERALLEHQRAFPE